MEFNKNNFDSLLKENIELKRKINQMNKGMERQRIIREVNSMRGCPWAIVGEFGLQLNGGDGECTGKCRECKEGFWNSVEEYLDNKYDNNMK